MQCPFLPLVLLTGPTAVHSDSWRSCSRPSHKPGCFASKTCKSSCAAATLQRQTGPGGRGWALRGTSLVVPVKLELPTRASEQLVYRETLSVTRWLSGSTTWAGGSLQGFRHSEGPPFCSHSIWRQCICFGL